MPSDAFANYSTLLIFLRGRTQAHTVDLCMVRLTWDLPSTRPFVSFSMYWSADWWITPAAAVKLIFLWRLLPSSSINASSSSSSRLTQSLSKMKVSVPILLLIIITCKICLSNIFFSSSRFHLFAHLVCSKLLSVSVSNYPISFFRTLFISCNIYSMWTTTMDQLSIFSRCFLSSVIITIGLYVNIWNGEMDAIMATL